MSAALGVRWMLSAAAAFVALALPAVASGAPARGDLVVLAETLHTMGPAGTIDRAIVVVRNGRIEAVGAQDELAAPPDIGTVLRAAVVTPGLIDARSTAGLTGIYNNPREDQDALEASSPMQPELRAIDAYNPRDPLIAYLRSFGITTLHTGHAPGQVISGQTFIVKTRGNAVEDDLLDEVTTVAATVSPQAIRGDGGAPGTRAKLVSLLRERLLRAREYRDAWQRFEADPQAAPPAAAPIEAPVAPAAPDTAGVTQPPVPPAPALPPQRRLGDEALVQVLEGELPLLVTANRLQDIHSALRLADEFGIRLWLDSAAEGYLMTETLQQRGIPVFIHSPMARAGSPESEFANATMTAAGRLADAGITVLVQSGFEGYVPKVRVVLFEAAIASAYGLGFERALAAITSEPARVLGIDGRVGSLEPGKDADLALYDGDPFEYTTHCTATIIEGVVVSNLAR